MAWFGYIWAAFALTVSISARYASALEARFGWRKLLWLAAALPIVGLLGMAWGAGWVGVLFGFAIQLSRGLSLTLFYDALNRRTRRMLPMGMSETMAYNAAGNLVSRTDFNGQTTNFAYDAASRSRTSYS